MRRHKTTLKRRLRAAMYSKSSASWDDNTFCHPSSYGKLCLCFVNDKNVLRRDCADSDRNQLSSYYSGAQLGGRDIFKKAITVVTECYNVQ